MIKEIFKSEAEIAEKSDGQPGFKDDDVFVSRRPDIRRQR